MVPVRRVPGCPPRRPRRSAHATATLLLRDICPRLALTTSAPAFGPSPWPFAVRVGYPCFGPPRRVGGKVVGYPAYGRWRVHNLFVNIYQLFPQYGVAQPYTVTQVYRF